MRTWSWLLPVVAAGCFVAGYSLHSTARATPIDPDTAVPLARSFAPWIKAMIQHKSTLADQLFVTPKSIYGEFESEVGKRILARFTGTAQHDLNLIAAKNLGRNTGIALFTISTQDGPVALRLYYYGYNTQIHIAHVDMADDWQTIEQMEMATDALQQPATVSLMGQSPDE